jgi:hypothetical protein
MGISLVTALTFGVPAASEAAGHPARISAISGGGDMLDLVWHWLGGLWGGLNGDSDGSTFATTIKSASTPPPVAGTATCGGDQGVCIDPNGK